MEEPMSSEPVRAVWSDGGDSMGRKGREWIAPHPRPLSSIDRKRPEVYAQRQLNGFWLKFLQSMLGWARLRGAMAALRWLGLLD